jgi:hypothetical protein
LNNVRPEIEYHINLQGRQVPPHGGEETCHASWVRQDPDVCGRLEAPQVCIVGLVCVRGHGLEQCLLDIG